MASVFEDTFVCREVDTAPKDPKRPDGEKVRDKKFDRVSRITAVSDNYKASLTLDVHSQLYPVRAGERFVLVLTPSVRLDGAPDDGTFDQGGEPTLLDKYDYAMNGKVFSYSPEDASSSSSSVTVYISFGGLLMALKGSKKTLSASDFAVDTRTYLLMKKV